MKCGTHFCRINSILPFLFANYVFCFETHKPYFGRWPIYNHVVPYSSVEPEVLQWAVEYNAVKLSCVSAHFYMWCCCWSYQNFVYHFLYKRIIFNIQIFCNIFMKDAGYIVYIHVKFEILVCGFHDKPNRIQSTKHYPSRG